MYVLGEKSSWMEFACVVQTHALCILNKMMIRNSSNRTIDLVVKPKREIGGMIQEVTGSMQLRNELS